MRDNSYKFALFLTRFMGRGFWYLFLGTMVFSALWDTNISWILGGFFTTYLIALGTAALVKGWKLSTKLQSVRELIINSGRGADQFIAVNQNCLTKVQFQAMVDSIVDQKDLFT